MAYLNLHRTAVGDFVSPVVALNNNWDQIDSKFTLLDSKTSPVGTGAVNPDLGMEVVGSKLPQPTIKVWNGSAYMPIAVSETWGAWTNITLAANYSAVSGRTPQLRVSNWGHVQCRGAVQYLTGTTAWLSGYQLINSGQFANATYTPTQVGVRNLTSSATGTTTWAYAQSFLTSGGGFLQIYLMYMGTTLASGNVISLDALSWYV